MKKNVLIFGATGFIGRNIVEDLYESNTYNLVLLIRNVQKNSNNFKKFEGITVIEGEISNSELIEEILSKHKIDLVIHLVSNLIPSSSYDDFNIELEQVVFPTFILLELLIKHNVKFVFFSSGGTIYGNSTGNISEYNPLHPINYYGYSKLMIENHIQFLHTTKQLSYLILRPANVYGKYQKIEARQGFIAVALGKILSNSSIEIWGNGEVVRDFIDVQDVSGALKKLLENNVLDRTFNVGSGEGNSLNEVLSIIETILETRIAIQYKDKREIDLDRMVLDISELNKHIEFNPKSLKKGINDFVAYIGKGDNGK